MSGFQDKLRLKAKERKARRLREQIVKLDKEIAKLQSQCNGRKGL